MDITRVVKSFKSFAPVTQAGTSVAFVTPLLSDARTTSATRILLAASSKTAGNIAPSSDFNALRHEFSKS